ncbi:hypothetical protein ASPZODRAFT_16127 [Penicilliopsis zonata CBS 506.65]|uniref:Uncharacterized protein n=1 Tax=Penicilliopsis zonata CBS 506.65 TaxID=1073090 RepID=A0A1L9SH04_9EURO|nr:hypothetical protein ASPZODRAFT_16127 [Penicilliopsis zonata CBS 506.65]OJJ46356.1 hypothetical protein ASPZODRAFT_16127 [Penicilliopsis zonata CBS 506.65]
MGPDFAQRPRSPETAAAGRFLGGGPKNAAVGRSGSWNGEGVLACTTATQKAENRRWCDQLTICLEETDCC